MPSSVSSSDDEGLTCLLDIVGGDSDHRADPTITTVKEDKTKKCCSKGNQLVGPG